MKTSIKLISSLVAVGLAGSAMAEQVTNNKHSIEMAIAAKKVAESAFGAFNLGIAKLEEARDNYELNGVYSSLTQENNTYKVEGSHDDTNNAYNVRVTIQDQPSNPALTRGKIVKLVMAEGNDGIADVSDFLCTTNIDEDLNNSADGTVIGNDTTGSVLLPLCAYDLSLS
jgi:hypothetical protein